MKIQVFISYCHEDVDPDFGRLEVFAHSLTTKGRGRFDIMVDYHNVKVGESLPNFMKKIDTADVVVVLLTPGYRERVARRGSTGVYTEFRRIHDRLLKSVEKKTYLRDFLILPVIFTATFKESCPPELANYYCKDLTWLSVQVDSARGRIPLTRGMKTMLDRFTTDLTEQIAAIAATKDEAYARHQQQLFKSFLFEDTKSRWDNPDNHQYLETAFVKTSSFLKVRDRQAEFVIGRKGAGKSTITHVLPLLSNPKPSLVLRLEFEHMAFEMCYNVLSAKPAEASDLRKAFSPIQSYQLLWDAFLHICYCWADSSRLGKRSKLRALLRRILGDGVSKNVDNIENATSVMKALFVYTFEQLITFVNSVVTKSLGSSLARSVLRFSVTPFREFVFGRLGMDELAVALDQYQRSSQRILVTADGFDVMVGYFTGENSNNQGPAIFERELLLGLFQVVLNKGPVKGAKSKLYDVTDFCVAVPYDRFLQARMADRDQYQYRSRFSQIEWSGIELSTLVRKRLALLRTVSDPKGKPLEDRLSAVMKRGFHEIPDEIIFRFGPALHHMPLFIYVLRHTFWRPRDVLYYYSALLAASERFPRNTGPLSGDFIRQVIASSTSAIVEQEFLNEFSGFIRNLPQILSTFRGGPQVFGWAEIRKRIEDMRFEANLPRGESASLEWKVELLHEVGLLGVLLDKQSCSRLSAYRHAFAFNEGILLGPRISRTEYPSLRYCLHPVFCEYLHLDTSNNPELIFPLSWRDLRENELLHGVPRF